MSKKKVTGLFEFQLGKMVEKAHAPGRKVKARVKALLIELGFSADYAEQAAEDILSDYLNGTMDEPIWRHPAYNR